MVEVTFLAGLDSNPATYFNVNREFDRTLKSGGEQAFFSDRTIYDSTVFTTQTDTSYLGHVIVAPNGRLGFDPDAVIVGTVGGASVKDFLAGEIADGKIGETIWRGLLGGDDVIRSNEDMVTLNGYDGDDVLVAATKAGPYGLTSQVSLDGDGGDDVLIAYPSFARKDGGQGADTFVVLGAGSDSSRYIASDFEHRVDTIALDSDAFPELGGKITRENFVLGTAAADADDRLIVSNAKGRATADVFYDSDGTGPEAQVLIGRVNLDRDLRRGDFKVVHASDFFPDAAPASHHFVSHEPLSVGDRFAALLHPLAGAEFALV